MGRGKSDAAYEDWSRQYEIFLPGRTTPYPAADLPLVRAIRGESVDQAELYIAYPSRDDGTWILVTGRPLRVVDSTLSRAEWLYSTTSLYGRRQSEDSLPNMRQRVFWPRQTRQANPFRRSSRRSANVSTGTWERSGELIQPLNRCAVGPSGESPALLRQFSRP